jgi:uncharacterized protein YciI
MLTMFHCFDADNTQQKRMSFLSAHLKWVEMNMIRIKVAGPSINESTQEIEGSLYIVEANSIADAEKLLQQDPYYKADIWQKIIKKEFKDYAGTWVGGKNWPNANHSE